MPAYQSDMQETPPSYVTRFSTKFVHENQDAIIASWKRLLLELSAEVEPILNQGPEAIPTIEYKNINNGIQAQKFSKLLKATGCGVIRGVVPQDVIRNWVDDAQQYLHYISNNGEESASRIRLREIFWSPAQVKARAHPSILDAQAFLLDQWHTSDPETAIANRHPITYADCLSNEGPEALEDPFRTYTLEDSSTRDTTYVDTASITSWIDRDPESHTSGGNSMRNWEQDDPWDSSQRFRSFTDLQGCSSEGTMLRMFNGWLCLDERHPKQSPFRVCPILRTTAAYIQLRPYFVPRNPSPTSENFLSSGNWEFRMPCASSLIQQPSASRKELSDALYPHLRLSETLLPCPILRPGDYLVWHSNCIYSPITTKSGHKSLPAGIHLSACPLTRDNALYLQQQRRAFLLGLPGPDCGIQEDSGPEKGSLVCRPDVQEISDVGGKKGLRAMGLLPWDEDLAETEAEVYVLEMANDILFPDRHDYDMG